MRGAAAERPEADADQRAADDALAPRRDGVDRRQHVAQQHGEHRHDDDAGGVADAPRPSRNPAALPLVDGERRDGGEVIGAGEHVKEPGCRAGEDR